MSPPVATALAVLAAQALVYGLPPWLVARRLTDRAAWPLTLLMALLLGLVSQSLGGLFWSRFVPGAAGAEAAVYVGLWLFLSLAVAGRGRTAARAAAEPPLAGREGAALIAILLLALAVRSLHPLQTWALGQSDAYTHLLMLRELLANGRLSNSGYPPGYSWTLALPAAVCGFDGYYVARFGGAFYGAALTLAVYGLVRFGGGPPRAALFSAFFAACFPGLTLLLKTGVGVFANQLGLMLVPAAFLGLLLAHRAPPARRGAWPLLAAALLGLLLAVPMMALHALLVLSATQLLLLAWHNAADRKRVARRLLWLLPTAALGLLPLLGAGRLWLARSACVLTQADEAFVAAPNQSEQMDVGSALWLLVRDYFGVKRWGFHQPLFDAAWLTLLAIFLGTAWWGFRKRQPGWLLLGCWGALATAQTATGLLQFTAYQREGWCLLMAIACLGGLAAEALWCRARWFRPVLAVGLAGCAGWTLAHPPTHTLTNSTAEEALVRIARMLRTYPQLPPADDAATEGLRQFLLTRLATNQPLPVMTRPLLQEFMLTAVAGPNPNLTFSRSNAWRTAPVDLANAPQTLVLLDERLPLASGDHDWLAKVSPELSRNYWRHQDLNYDVNECILHCLRRFSPSEWRIEEHAITDQLRALVVRRGAAVTPPVTNTPAAEDRRVGPGVQTPDRDPRGEDRPLEAAAPTGRDARKAGQTMSLDLGGGVTLELAWIPPGEFVMGSPADERGRSDDEGPPHRVVISRGFWMGRYEVTQAQWDRIMGRNPSYYRGANRPVEVVSWNDCQEFLRKLNATVKLEFAGRFALPTEAEWEYACRAGSTARFYTGDSDVELDRIAWNQAISDGKTHPVGEKTPNAWGLYDTCGNVWEWCQDWYVKDYYATSPVPDPLGPSAGTERVVRGGSWFYYGVYCRSASRDGYAPAYRYSNIGCRLVIR